MSDETIIARPTSKTTADVEPIVLRAGEKSRLVFRPALVDNTSNPAASVRGILCYQKKRLSDAWGDIEAIKLTSLKDGEGVRLELRSEDLLKLYNAVGSLYDIMQREGLPTRRTDYIPAPRSGLLRQLLQDGELEEVLGHDAQGGPIIRKFLSWISKRQSSSLMSALNQLDAAQLLNFDAAIGAARLSAFLKDWEEGKDRSDEGYWQELLTANSWVLSQLFASPIVLIKDQAYVGGKGIDNRGGNIADFLYSNPLTRDAVLVEIKTPAADLLAAAAYRNNTWPPSEELSGGTQQLLTNRYALVQKYQSLIQEDSPPSFKTFHPRALLVIGSVERELTMNSKRRCFEQYRRNLRDIEVVTFDEIYAKAKQFIELLDAS